MGMHTQGIKVYTWDDFYAVGEKKPTEAVPPKPEDPATIMYTSGTTGQCSCSWRMQTQCRLWLLASRARAAAVPEVLCASKSEGPPLGKPAGPRRISSGPRDHITERRRGGGCWKHAGWVNVAKKGGPCGARVWRAGNPKGVVLTHTNVLATVKALQVHVKLAGFAIRPDDSVLSYLTLAHIFGRCVEEFVLSLGAQIGYWQARTATPARAPVRPVNRPHAACAWR